MARGKKLSDAYLELRADDSKLSGDVKVKARKIGKEFGSQLNRALDALNLDPIDLRADPKTALASIAATRDRLRELSNAAESVEMRIKAERAISQVERFRRQLGAVDDTPVEPKVEVSPAERQIGQLRRQLTALGIDPIDIDADPAAALAAIRRVDEQLRRLSGDAATVHVRVDAESARDGLARLRKMLGDAGGDAAPGFVAQLGAKVGPLIARLPLSPHLAVAVAAAGAAAAPTLAAALSAGVLGGAGAGGIIGGLIAAGRHPAVKASAQQTGDAFTDALERAGVSFVPATLDALAKVRGRIPDLEDDLTRALSRASQFIDPLTDDFLSGAEAGIEGFADAVERSGPVVAVVGNIFERTGKLAGDALTGMSEHSVEAAHALAALWTVLEFGARLTLGTIEGLTTLSGWAEKFGYVLTGNTEALGRMAAEQATAKASGDNLGEGLRDLINSFTASGDAAGDAAVEIKTYAQLLDDMTGRTIGAEQASIRLEESIDQATEAAKRNGAGIDVNVPKQRANREALVAIADAAKLSAQRIYEQTNSQELASAATERGRRGFLAAAAAMHVSAAEANRLADELFGIPGSRTVTVKALTDKATGQIIGFEKKINQLDGRVITVRTRITSAGEYIPGVGTLTRAEGGSIYGPGPRGIDSVHVLAAPGEFMQPVPAVDYYGVAAMEAIRQRKIPRDVLQGYATGGLIDHTPPAHTVPARVAAARPLVMDSGGRLMPGWNPPVWNGTGRPEAVTTAASMDKLAALLTELVDWQDVINEGIVKLIDAVRRVGPDVADAHSGVTRGALYLARGRV